jgi:hypothetical protein
MATWAQIEQALRAWIMTTTGLHDSKVIFADQDAPRPVSGPFATIKGRLSRTRIGAFDEEAASEDDDSDIIRTQRRRLTVSINLIGTDALSLADDASDGLDRYDVREALDAVGLAVIDPGDVRDLTGLIETRHEERGQFDAVFHMVSQTTETVGWIEIVEGTATYTDAEPDGSDATQDFTFEA